MKRSVLFLFVVISMAFSGFARAEEIDDLYSAPPVQDASPTEYNSGQWAPIGEPITSEDRLPPRITQDDVKFQNFSFDTMCYIDPVAVVQQKKLAELDKRNVLILSIRRSKMVGNRANDLQVDFAYKGQLSKYVCVKNGRLIYRYCGNPIVVMIADQPINLKIKSEYITQIQEICRTTMQQYGCPVQPQQPQQIVCKPTYRRPGFAMKDTRASSNWVYEEGIVKLCISWLLNPPKFNNNQSQTANGGTSENTNNNGNVNNNTNPISVGVAN